MRIRYRKLERSFDARSYATMVGAASAEARSQAKANQDAAGGLGTSPSEAAAGAAIVATVAGLVSAPDEVTATEGDADLEEVRAMLRRGALNAEDLVNLGDGWTTIRQCVPLADDAEPAPPADSTQVVVVVVGFLLVAAVIAALVALLA